MAKSPYDYFMETLSKTNPTSHKILKSLFTEEEKKKKTGGKATKRLSPAMAQNKRRMEAMRKDADMTISKKTAKVDPSKKVRPQGTTKSKNYNLGVSKGGVPFKEAFAHFRKKGNKTFTWNGKKYTTELKKDKK